MKKNQIILSAMTLISLTAFNAQAAITAFWYFGTDSGGAAHDASRVRDPLNATLSCGSGVQLIWAGSDGLIDPPDQADCTTTGDDEFVQTNWPRLDLNSFGSWTPGSNDGVCDGVLFTVPDKTGRFCHSDALKTEEENGDPVDWDGRLVYVRAYDGQTCGSSAYYGQSSLFSVQPVEEPGGTLVWRRNFGPFQASAMLRAAPVITSLHRDKHLSSSPHIAGWADITFDSISGVTYDIYVSPSMTSPGWTIQGEITASGASTTYRDNGPVFSERYYRVAIQGPVPVIYSTNEGGVLPSTVLDKNGVEMSQGAILGVSLNSTEPATTIQEVIGWQMVGSDIPDTSTEIWAWETAPNAYTLTWLIDGMGPTYDGTWWDNNLGGPATIDMSLGAGFWAFNKQASVQTVYMDGIVQQTPYPMTVYVNATLVRSHLQGQPAAGDVSIQDAEYFLDGAKGSDIPDTADEIWQFDQTTNAFTLTWLMNGFGPTYDGRWWDNNLGDFSTINLARGTGWWYFSKLDPSRTPQWSWTEPVPY